MTPSLEKVAWAIADEIGPYDSEGFHHIDEEAIARAALQALIPPGPEVVLAMCEAWHDCPEGDGPEEMTSAMLTAAIRSILGDG